MGFDESRHRSVADLRDLALVAGGLLWWVTVPGTVRARDVFSAVGWTWLVVTLVGAFRTSSAARSTCRVLIVPASSSTPSSSRHPATAPLAPPASPTSSIPARMMMHRQITQWYGGMGMVVIAVAVLPFLGVGGMDLMSAEAPGPSGDRLTPRVSETAKRLWFTYVLFTVGVSVTLIAIPGPSVYDAIAHGLTTIATGGFSPHADSIGTFDSGAVELAIIVGMVLGGTNFALHWRAVTGDRLAYWRDPEFRTYLKLLIGASVLVIALLWLDAGLGSPKRSGPACSTS